MLETGLVYYRETVKTRVVAWLSSWPAASTRHHFRVLAPAVSLLLLHACFPQVIQRFVLSVAKFAAV